MTQMYDVVSFGDAMVSLIAPNHARLEQASQLQMAMAGAELNVAVNTATLGLKSTWVSKLVDVWSGRYIANKARERGVDTSNIKFIPFDGMGKIRNSLCFIEVGIGPRPSKQVYDRGHSAVSLIEPGEIDWERILGQTKWFHTTGISTALSDNVANEAITALKTAKKLGVKTSFDLNFRSTLWSSEKAQKVMQRVIPFVDVLIGNEEDFEKMLNIKAEGVAEGYAKINPENYKSVAKKALQLYPSIQVVATTLRDAKTGLLNDWQTVMLYQGEFFVSRKYEDLEILDRTGGGDSFAAGLIYSMITGKAPQEMIEFSAAYSALCHGFLGDWNWATKEEAENVMRGANARVIR